MLQNSLPNNEVCLNGEIDSNLKFSHEVYGEGFYNFILKTPRLSNIYDFICITISERLFKDLPMRLGDKISVNGQFRSYNNYASEGNRLLLTVFAKDIKEISDEATQNPNIISLNGYICKEPIYRVTPFGREICDILLAVNRSYNKSDYIPCIAWGRNARFASRLKIGDNIKISGRVQSREYQKKISDEEIITKVAYEVSICKMEYINKSQEIIWIFKHKF